MIIIILLILIWVMIYYPRFPGRDFYYIPCHERKYKLEPVRGKVNRQGYIGKSYPYPRNNKHRVLLVGDSIGADDHIRQELERLSGWEIFNSCCPGYNLKQYYYTIKQEIEFVKPDEIIVFIFMNDCEEDYYVYKYGKDGIDRIEHPFVYMHPRPFLFYIPLIRDIALKYYKAKDRQLKSKLNYKPDFKSEKDFGRYHAAMIYFYHYQVSVKFIVFDYLRSLTKYQPYQKKNWENIHNIMQPYNPVDAYASFTFEELESMKKSRNEDVHPNKEGQIKIARALYERLSICADA